jgi:hypothetical protein
MNSPFPPASQNRAPYSPMGQAGRRFCDPTLHSWTGQVVPQTSQLLYQHLSHYRQERPQLVPRPGQPLSPPHLAQVSVKKQRVLSPQTQNHLRKFIQIRVLVGLHVRHHQHDLSILRHPRPIPMAVFPSRNNSGPDCTAYSTYTPFTGYSSVATTAAPAGPTRKIPFG